MQKFIMADGCALRISDTGPGRRLVRSADGGERNDTPAGEFAVVLLHGFLESLEVWDGFTELLSPHFRVIAPDLPGHGIAQVMGPVHTMEFMADVVVAAVAALGVERFVVVGHSMGGYVTAELVRKYPERLIGAVMLHSTPNADNDAKREARLREIELVEQGKKELIARVNAEKRFAADNITRLAVQVGEVTEQVVLTEDEGVVAALRGMMARRDNNEAMRTSRVPQLFIFGRKDEHIPVEVARAVAEAQPQARVVWLDNSGHMGFIEEPATCAEAIIDFAEKL